MKSLVLHVIDALIDVVATTPFLQ